MKGQAMNICARITNVNRGHRGQTMMYGYLITMIKLRCNKNISMSLNI